MPSVDEGGLARLESVSIYSGCGQEIRYEAPQLSSSLPRHESIMYVELTEVPIFSFRRG